MHRYLLLLLTWTLTSPTSLDCVCTFPTLTITYICNLKNKNLTQLKAIQFQSHRHFLPANPRAFILPQSIFELLNNIKGRRHLHSLLESIVGKTTGWTRDDLCSWVVYWIAEMWTSPVQQAQLVASQLSHLTHFFLYNWYIGVPKQKKEGGSLGSITVWAGSPGGSKMAD